MLFRRGTPLNVDPFLGLKHLFHKATRFIGPKFQVVPRIAHVVYIEKGCPSQ